MADLQEEKRDLGQQVKDLQEESEDFAQQVVDLKQKNEDLKKRVQRGCDRSRSPQRPASSSQANLNTTCKAFARVSQWQRDTVVQEQTDEIQRLRAEVASLRRGEGPLGDVLAHNDALTAVKYNFQRSPEYAASIAEGFAKETMTVGEGFEKVMKFFGDGYSFVQRGSHR